MRWNLAAGLALVAIGGTGGVMLAPSGTVTPLGVAAILTSIAMVLIGAGVAVLGDR